MKKYIIPILIALLLLSSGFVGMSNTVKEKHISDKDINLNSYDSSEIFNHRYESLPDDFEITTVKTSIDINHQQVVNTGPMDSPWPMYCHDTRHTGRNPYSTVNTWDEIWRFKQDANDYVRGSPVIGDDGTIYFGGMDFYALYPNGSLKWKYDDLSFYVWSAPAIDENGTIYVDDLDGYFYAINPDGTLKWKYCVEGDIFSSPAIGNDGTIYFGNEVGYPLGGYINALYPNGTVKWRYKTGHVVYSSPAIGDDGIVYCSSHDTYLYALYPNNGTLKWKYKTGHWIRTSPCIADDGTIYIVSLDDHLHAVNLDGSLKWKTNMGEGGTSPTIGQDNTIYAGYRTLHAIYPTNGSVKWTFDVSGKIKGSTPCHSLEDTIYFGSGSWLYAVNSDGTLKWREKITNEFIDSAPAIGEDGTVYVGSAASDGGYSLGYLHAFGIGKLEADADGPHYGLINNPMQFSGLARGGYQPYSWLWDFGDGNTSDEQNPTHTYTYPSNFTVTLTVTDNSSNTSDDSTWAWIQASNDPPDKPSINGTINGAVGVEYDYTFLTTDPDGNDIWYGVSWGGPAIRIYGPYLSGEELILSHSWSEKGSYTIECHAFDVYGELSETATLEVTMPMNQQTQNVWYLRWLERFPRLQKILDVLRLNLR
ncbi:MAG: PQQ-binding-like beta-propeller repeat protein [Thermoplasmatales archaeon]|nr:MAG: PQQ-binding-like beta-propeller repeat protein [Thermoplasmatales archaeon]